MRTIVAALAAALAVLAGPARAQKVSDIDVVWVGTYRIAGTRAVEDVTAPTGYRYLAQGIEPVESTQRVAAAVGTRFGVGYVLKGEPADAVVPVHAYWRFPPRGLSNPETRTTVFEWKTGELACRIGQQPFCLMGYPLQHAWELVPGRWTLEIWAAGDKLLETFFDLHIP